ncbi:hypothetical protein PHJA_002321500 [Phtheirospermum japonicum]|uniref:Uncharacterized protein n=1 Tax=Phtheirospermum japonicum TaxID=374723 RepID=A0A830D3M0_9LAMI|nr:hypothetical protein PHJA_002321500 [Phtheirospermum japonicum]
MSSSRRDVCAVESSNDCKTLFSALEEVQHKGTLIDRLALLENRVLQLSLEMDEGNTSRSSSSTAQISIPIPKRQDDDNHCLHFNTKQMQHPSTTHQVRHLFFLVFFFNLQKVRKGSTNSGAITTVLRAYSFMFYIYRSQIHSDFIINILQLLYMNPVI